MASATMTVNVRLRRLGPFQAWMWLAARLVRVGLSTETTVAVANRLLGLVQMECRTERGRLLNRTAFTGRLEMEP